MIEKEFQSGLELWDRYDGLKSLLSEAFPKDDSAFVWSEISHGVSDSLDVTFEKIFARYITKFDQKNTDHGKSDEDVWRNFKRDLEQRNVLRFFEPKTISGRDDEVEFSLAWKNGIWHCVEPISFDLSAQETIRDKAHRFLGQLTSVSDANEKFKLYIVAAKPRDPHLSEAFDRAISILDKIPTDKEIYTDEQAGLLADRFSVQIAADIASNEAGLHF